MDRLSNEWSINAVDYVKGLSRLREKKNSCFIACFGTVPWMAAT